MACHDGQQINDQALDEMILALKLVPNLQIEIFQGFDDLTHHHHFLPLRTPGMGALCFAHRVPAYDKQLSSNWRGVTSICECN